LVASFDLNIKLMLSAGRFVFLVASFDLNIKSMLSACRCIFFGSSFDSVCFFCLLLLTLILSCCCPRVGVFFLVASFDLNIKLMLSACRCVFFGCFF